MPKYRNVEYIRDPLDGDGVAGITVDIKLHNGGGTVDTDTTDANGRAEFPHDDVAYPGPVYTTATSGGTTRVRSGNVWGQLGGLIWPDDVPDTFAVLGIGVINGAGSEFACTGSGVDRVITVASGAALLKDGFPFVLDAATTVTLGAADGSNPRIDRVVLRLVREGETDQGKITIEVVAGTPAASPTAPALTQSSSTWEYSLCQILVGTGVTSISTGNITSEIYSTALNQAYAFGYPTGLRRGDLFYVNSAGKLVRLGVGTSGYVLTSDGSDPAWAAPPAPTSGINATAVADGSVTNTEYQYIGTLSSNAQTQLDGKAETSHTHTASQLSDVTASATELNYTDGVTSNIQTQLDARIDAYTDTPGVTANFGDGTNVITSSEPAVYITVPYSCTISLWEVRSSISGSITFVVDRAVTGSSTFTNIDGSEPPLLSSASFNSDTSLSSWTTSLAARDTLRITVSGSPTGVVRAAVFIRFNRSIT
jgi:hypothetical protein